MGRVFTPAVIASSVDTLESTKKAQIACPYPKWSPGLFDPDSDEFFVDFVDERYIGNPPPLSPVESNSSLSDVSDREPSPADGPQPLAELIRDVRADVDNLTWLARVPSDAHDVPDARDVQADAATSSPRTRSISDAAGRQQSQSSARHGSVFRHATVEQREDVRADEVINEPVIPAAPSTPVLASATLSSTPSRLSEWYTPRTPTSGANIMSPPPSVTPRVFSYNRHSHSYTPMSSSPTASLSTRAARRAFLPAF